MNTEKQLEPIVISLGGSIIVPDTVDADFIQQFKELIADQVERTGRRFFLITGGGKVCRYYQSALTSVLKEEVSNNSLDWMGVYVTQLNARLIQMAFGDMAESEIISDKSKLKSSYEKPVVIGSGWEPGSSSDLRAVQIAEAIGAHRLINLSNVSHVYSADPKEDPEAEKISDMTWEELRALLPREWDPGLNVPFDPIAAEKAEEIGLEVAIMNGRDLENVKNYLEGEEFEGTVVHA